MHKTRSTLYFPVCSVTPWGLLLPQILRLCRLIFPDKWRAAVKNSSSSKSLKTSQHNMHRTSSIGQLHIAKISTCNFKMSNFSLFFFLLCLDCLVVWQHTWLICVEYERKLPNLHSHQLQWLVLSEVFFSYTYKSIFCWRFHSTHRTKCPLLCSHRTHLASYTWKAIFTSVSIALQVERFGNSNGVNYKLDYNIVKWVKFSFTRLSVHGQYYSKKAHISCVQSI
jgi:hypothetical protein